MTDRATEQEKLNVSSSNINSTICTNGTFGNNTTQELNLDFFLGIYAGMLIVKVSICSKVQM